MTGRRGPPRNTKGPIAPTAAASHRLLTPQTFTLIASWRGQLLICTVVLVVGAIYFVVREPVRQWRRRQRERISRALTEELIAAETKASASPAGDEKDQAGPSTGSSTAVAHKLTARERGRERRKETKKHKHLLRASAPSTAANSGEGSLASTSSAASVESSPAFSPLKLTDTVPSVASQINNAESSSALTPRAPVQPYTEVTISLESSASEAEIIASPPILDSTSPMTPSQPNVWNLQSPIAEPSRLTPPGADSLEVSTDGGETSEHPDSDPGRAVYSPLINDHRLHSAIPEEAYMPMSSKRKKRKSKARSTSERPAEAPAHPMGRSINLSSDSMSSPSLSQMSLATPGSPSTPRRRRKTSIAGVPMTPALELLLGNHERTIDSLRAEIGHAKAEESKARDDEVRAREELRRSRATEDRMRSDYERARKTRDRAETENRRLENEIMLMRSRFDTLTYMYHSVCNRLRELEMGRDAGGPHHSPHPHGLSPHPHGPSNHSHMSSPQLGTPFISFPQASPGPPMGYFPYMNGGAMYSPAAAHGFAPPGAHSPSPYRRMEGTASNGDLLAGPLTPGLSAPSTMPTPPIPSAAVPSYPSDLSLALSAATPSSTTGTTGTSESNGLSAAEVRRLHIASSVLKKKSKPAEASESGDSNAQSGSSKEGVAPSAGDAPTSDASPRGLGLGLGISQLANVPSAFPSAGEQQSPKAPSKKHSGCSSSSGASSAELGRHILITPSNAEVFHRTGRAPDSLTGVTPNGNGVFTQEPEEHVDDDQNDAACAIDTTTTTKSSTKQNDLNDHHNHHHHHHSNNQASDDRDDTDFAPMFASLAHTPEQLAEIARMREEAIRERERRTRGRSASANDL